MTVAQVRSRWTGVAPRCHTNRMHNAFQSLVILSILTISACGPCDDVIVAGPGGHIQVCHPDDGGMPETSNDDGTTMADPTDGAVCEPAPGTPWGSCHDGACETIGGVQSVCSGSDSGTICLPVCIGNECADFGCSADCGGDDVYETCTIACAVDSDCPANGMTCTGSMCTWPF